MTLKKGVTLIELMIVILIVGILAAASIPTMRGRVGAAKWSEAKVCVGTIKRAVRAHVAAKDPNCTDFSEIEGSLGDSSIASLLGFTDTSLDGSYFNQSDYSISRVKGLGTSAAGSGSGTCVVEVTSSHRDGPRGAGTFAADGTWSMITDGEDDENDSE